MDYIYVAVNVPKDVMLELLRKAHTTSKAEAILKAIEHYLQE